MKKNDKEDTSFIVESAIPVRYYVKAYKDFLNARVLDGKEQIVFIHLKQYLDLLQDKGETQGEVFPTLETIAKNVMMSEKTIRTILKKLQKKGIIEIKQQGLNKPNIYKINDYHSMWEAGITNDERKKQIQQEEEKAMIKLLESKGYKITREKELESEPTKAQNQAPSKNLSPKENNTKEKEKSQEENKNDITLDEIKRIYQYDKLIQENLEKKQDIDSIINIIHKVMNIEKAIRISGRFTKADIVKEKLKKLTSEHILYVIRKFREQTKEIKNPTAYLITMLYHAPEQYNLDKINQEAQKNITEEKPQEKRKNINKFCNFEQHSYSKEDMELLERALLRNSENITRKNDRIEPYTDK